jgi:hypothetical protein
MVAMSALAAAAPAAAQYSNQDYRSNQGYGSGQNYAGANAAFGNRIARLDARLQAGIQSGEIDRREARMLRQQIGDLRRLERQYSYNGLTTDERTELQQRIRTARDDLRLADGGIYDRDQRYAWDDDDNGYYGRGGPYEEVDVCESRTGIGGLIDNITGNNCGPRVGQRATGNLYAVPYNYRNMYRDNSRSYFRSDGRQIYEIDARSNVVVRAHPMNR